MAWKRVQTHNNKAYTSDELILTLDSITFPEPTTYNSQYTYYVWAVNSTVNGGDIVIIEVNQPADGETTDRLIFKDRLQGIPSVVQTFNFLITRS